MNQTPIHSIKHETDDSNPPVALDKFIEESGLSPVTVWRYRKADWLKTLNRIQGSYQLAIVGPDGKAEIRPVQAGPLIGTDWVITTGLKPGEQVIVEGFQKVKSGMPAVPKPWIAPEKRAVTTGVDSAKKTTEAPVPFHGYYYKVLKSQGSDAPGGEYNYVINGNMIAGFSLLAWPSIYGQPGIMTFIVNQQGRVYQKNFGPRTATVAAMTTQYNPDKSWKLVEDELPATLPDSGQKSEDGKQ